jgi:hypothetical protein
MGVGDARRVGITERVHDDAVAVVGSKAAEVGGIDEYPAFGDQLGHAGISAKGAAANGSIRNFPRKGPSRPLVQGLPGSVRDRTSGDLAWHV